MILGFNTCDNYFISVHMMKQKQCHTLTGKMKCHTLTLLNLLSIICSTSDFYQVKDLAWVIYYLIKATITPAEHQSTSSNNE